MKRILLLTDDVYGFCLYQNENKLYAFVNGKDGNIEQWLPGKAAPPCGSIYATYEP